MRPVQRWVAIVSRLKKKSGSPEKNFGKCCTNETSGELPQDGATHHLHSGYLLPQVQLITFTQPPPKNLTSSPTAYIPYIQINTHIHNKRCTQTLASIFLYKALLENKRARCTLTIFFFWQRNAWHSKVSLNWLWETYAKTLSWVLSAVQYEILEEKKKKEKKNQQTSY